MDGLSGRALCCKPISLLFGSDMSLTSGSVAQDDGDQGQEGDCSQRNGPTAACVMNEAEQGRADCGKQIADGLRHPGQLGGLTGRSRTQGEKHDDQAEGRTAAEADQQDKQERQIRRAEPDTAVPEQEQCGGNGGQPFLGLGACGQ